MRSRKRILSDNKRWMPLSLIAAAFASWLTPSVATAESCTQQSDSRFALVIGNSYSGSLSGRLDAELIALHLCQLGFSVDLFPDASFRQLEGDGARQDDGALAEFRRKIRNAKEVIFFYSGHGYQIGGKNYLLPNDRDFSQNDPQLPLSRVLWALKGAPDEAVKIVFLDACRTLTGPPAAGLTEVHDLPPTTLLAFATEYGRTAPSGRAGQISPYTAALAKSMREPGLEIYDLLAQVSRELAASGSGQAPVYQLNAFFPRFLFDGSSLLGRSFGSTAAAAVDVERQAEAEQEAETPVKEGEPFPQGSRYEGPSLRRWRKISRGRRSPRWRQHCRTNW